MPAEAMHATRVPLQFDTRPRQGNGAWLTRPVATVHPVGGRPSNASRIGLGSFVNPPQVCQMQNLYLRTSGPSILQKVCSRRTKSGPQ